MQHASDMAMSRKPKGIGRVVSTCAPPVYKPCTCKNCTDRVSIGLEPLRFPRADITRTLCKRLAHEVTEAQARLSLIFEKLGPKIVKHWRCKDFKQREKLLTKTCVATRRPELELRSELMDDRRMKQAFRYLHMNAEDLSRSDNILSLLKARAEHHPGHFALFDLQNAGVPLCGHDKRQDDELASLFMLLSANGSDWHSELEVRN